MVIDFFYISRPSARQWSSISSHRGPLRGNGHRSLYIKTLCKAMVIDFLCHIEALCEAMVIDLFTSRPSAKQWSLIPYVTSRPSTRQRSSISLHQDPLRGNGHWFLLSHRGPLRGNGHRSLYIKTLYGVMVIFFLCHIEAICEAMVIDFRIGTLYMVMVIESFRYRISHRDWSNLFFKKSKYKKNMVCQIVTLYMVMVTESFGYRPSPRVWSNLFSKNI